MYLYTVANDAESKRTNTGKLQKEKDGRILVWTQTLIRLEHRIMNLISRYHRLLEEEEYSCLHGGSFRRDALWARKRFPTWQGAGHNACRGQQ